MWRRRPGSRCGRWPAATRPSPRRSRSWTRSSTGWWRRPHPELLALPAVGTHHAATLLVLAGDNPDRLKSEASFASLRGSSSCGSLLRQGGTPPPESGWQPRRQPGAAHDLRGPDGLRPAQLLYVARRLAEGRGKWEIMKCLKPVHRAGGLPRPYLAQPASAHHRCVWDRERGRRGAKHRVGLDYKSVTLSGSQSLIGGSVHRMRSVFSKLSTASYQRMPGANDGQMGLRVFAPVLERVQELRIHSRQASQILGVDLVGLSLALA